MYSQSKSESCGCILNASENSGDGAEGEDEHVTVLEMKIFVLLTFLIPQAGYGT